MKCATIIVTEGAHVSLLDRSPTLHLEEWWIKMSLPTGWQNKSNLNFSDNLVFLKMLFMLNLLSHGNKTYCNDTRGHQNSFKLQERTKV